MSTKPRKVLVPVPAIPASLRLVPDPGDPDASNGPPRRGAERAARSADLLARAHAATEVHRRRGLQDEAVTLNMGVARSIAARYRRRGVADDDLDQVAYLGLVKAVQGFDPGFERDFLVYAVPTIRGEIKRHFRNHGWAVRPPRRLQELQSQISVASQELTQRLGRSPTPAEVADHLDEDVEEVIAALAANGSFASSSLDQPMSDDASTTYGDRLGREDDGPRAVEARVMLAPAVRELSRRDQHVLYLRFFGGQTQTEIAATLGVSQMQVSRLIARILRTLRDELAG